jgi:hypothetical protein
LVNDRVSYDRDLLVFQDHVQVGWRRKDGHLLRWEDVRDAVESFKPAVLVVGTGRFGRMKVDPSVPLALDALGVALEAESTDRAVKAFNRLLLSGVKVAGAFHLTC